MRDCGDRYYFLFRDFKKWDAPTGTVIGSPEYVAPQVRGKPAFASDIYSLGVTCIYLLTQVSPFDLFDLSQDAWVWRDYLVDNPVDEWLGKVLDKMIANALGQRYQSAPAVRAALENRYPRTATLDRRDYLAIDIAGGSLNNCQFVPPSVKPAHSIDRLAIQPFGFETAKLVMAKAFWGGTKSVVQKSQGIANRFFQDLGSGVRLEMIGIPAGTLLMGAPKLEAGSSDSQRPQHRVRVTAFYMGKYPVTQAQYQVIMGSNPAYFQGGDRPVETVSWHDAVEFCRKLSQLTTQQYRLPSEAEWEYACRAGTTTPFCFGETISPEVVNYQSEETTVVGTFPANSYGLSDLHGNILEWCADKYHRTYTGAPTDGSAWSNDRHQTYVLRGGCWYSKLSYCRSAARIYYKPDYRCSYFGLRVVCS